jgi:hypothetical protein
VYGRNLLLNIFSSRDWDRLGVARLLGMVLPTSEAGAGGSICSLVGA